MASKWRWNIAALGVWPPWPANPTFVPRDFILARLVDRPGNFYLSNQRFFTNGANVFSDVLGPRLYLNTEVLPIVPGSSFPFGYNVEPDHPFP